MYCAKNGRCESSRVTSPLGVLGVNFGVNVLETCREYLLTIDLQIVEFIEKNYRALF